MVKKFNLWKTLTDLPKVKIGSSLVLQLDDDTQDTILEFINEEGIGQETDAQTVLEKLRKYSKRTNLQLRLSYMKN